MNKIISSFILSLCFVSGAWAADTSAVTVKTTDLSTLDRVAVRQVAKAIGECSDCRIAILHRGSELEIDISRDLSEFGVEVTEAPSEQVGALLDTMLKTNSRDLVLARAAKKYLVSQLEKQGVDIYQDPMSSTELQALMRSVANQLAIPAEALVRWPDFREWIYSNGIDGDLLVYGIQIIPGRYGRPIMVLKDGKRLDYYESVDRQTPMGPHKKMVESTLTRDGLVPLAITSETPEATGAGTHLLLLFDEDEASTTPDTSSPFFGPEEAPHNPLWEGLKYSPIPGLEDLLKK